MKVPETQKADSVISTDIGLQVNKSSNVLRIEAPPTQRYIDILNEQLPLTTPCQTYYSLVPEPG